MLTSKQEIFTFRGATPEQVDDLCELWKESVVDCNRQRGIVRVMSDAVAVDQFLLFYELCNAEEQPVNDFDAPDTPRYH